MSEIKIDYENLAKAVRCLKKIDAQLADHRSSDGKSIAEESRGRAHSALLDSYDSLLRVEREFKRLIGKTLHFVGYAAEAFDASEEYSSNLMLSIGDQSDDI